MDAPQPAPRQLAIILAQLCIGCTKCVAVCPTGAIAGARRQQHGVQTGLCTGCGHCAEVCPVHCISFTPLTAPHPLQDAPTALATATQAHTARKLARKGPLPTAAAKPQAQAVAVEALPADLLSLVQQARAKSAQKYASKGPLRPPKALAQHKG
jgi:electron transport complex protein RnfB